MPSLILSDNGVSSGSAGLKTTAASDGSLALQTSTAGGAATTAVTINTSQNVGIGTSSPAEKLTVNGTVAVTGGITGHGANRTTLSQEGANGAFWQSYGANTSTIGTFKIRQASSDFSLNRIALEIDSSGNLGLGITPSAWVIGGAASALQVKNASLYGDGASAITSSNCFFNASWKYIATAAASQYEQSTGAHKWYNAPSGTAGNAITFTQAMTLDASGNLGIGTTSPVSPLTAARGNVTGAGQWASSAIAVYNPTNIGSYSQIAFGYTVGTTNAAAYMGFVSTNQGTNGFGDLVFGTRSVNTDTQPTERARIDSSGNLLVGTTSLNFGLKGVALYPSGLVEATVAGAPCMNVNRLTDDGVLFGFYQASTLEGNISVSGTTVSYNGGHLSRYAQTLGNKDESIVKGTVLSNLDAMNVYADAEGNVASNEQLNKVKVSDVEGDVNVAGVFVNWSQDEQHNVDEINMAMTGDMIIRITQGTTVQRGDLLMSAGDGTAKPQGDDIIRSKTVAKVTSTHITCTYEDGSYCVPCVLMAC